MRSRNKFGNAIKCLSIIVVPLISNVALAAQRDDSSAKFGADGSNDNAGDPAYTPDPAAVEREVNQTFFPITLPVFDVDAPVGTVNIQLSRSGDYKISKESILPLLQRIAGKASADNIGRKLPDSDTLTATDIENSGFSLIFDAQRVALILNLPVDGRQANEIAISAPPSEPRATAARVEPENFSAYTNFAFALENTPSVAGASTRKTLLLQSALRGANFVLENEAFVEAGSGSGRTLSRSATRLSYDFPSAGIRASMGDVFSNSKGFLRSQDLLGVSLFKNTEVFSPFAATRPTGKQSFSLARSANVDIFVNGQIVRQVRLAPGSYDLTNFAQTEGANDIRIETRDDMGEFKSINFTSFFDSELLAPDISEWQLNAGVQSSRFDRQISYNFDEAVVSGFYRRGVSETLTVGGSMEVRENRALVGGEIVSANSIGNMSLDFAASYAGHEIGAAMSFTLQPRLPTKLQSPSRSFDLFAEVTTAKFGDNSFNGLGESLRVGFRYTDLIVDGRISVAASGSYTSEADSVRDGFDLSLSAGYRFASGLVARVTPNYRQSTNGDSEAAIRFSLTKSFGRRSRARTTYDTRDNRMLGEFDYTSQFGGVGTYGMNVVASRADTEEANLTASANYIGNRFEANANYTQFIEGPDGFERGRATAVFETALAFAGGKVAIGRPVRDSFAIAYGYENIGARQILIDPAINDRGDRARSGALGPALISDMGSYSMSKPSYSVKDLPIGYDLGTGTFELFPPHRSGYALQVGSARNASLVGIAVDSEGKPLSLVRGTITSEEDEGFGEKIVFTNRAGRFGLIGLKPGVEYHITIPAADFTFDLRVPEGADGLVNVGKIKSGSR